MHPLYPQSYCPPPPLTTEGHGTHILVPDIDTCGCRRLTTSTGKGSPGTLCYSLLWKNPMIRLMCESVTRCHAVVYDSIVTAHSLMMETYTRSICHKRPLAASTGISPPLTTSTISLTLTWSGITCRNSTVSKTHCSITYPYPCLPSEAPGTRPMNGPQLVPSLHT